MRKITQLAIEAFIRMDDFTMGNTKVRVVDNTAILTLFGNAIAYKEAGGDIRITNARWRTNTTKDRLNGIPGVCIQQKKGVWYLNGIEWDGSIVLINHKQKPKVMNVFNQLKSDNGLDAAQLDSVVNTAFDRLIEIYSQFSLSYDEDGVSISNFDNCNDEETGGFEKHEVEANLTDELLKIATTLL